MRTAIILVGVLIASAILRGVEAAYGVKVAPNEAATFEIYVIAACIVMDIVEFVRGLTKRAAD